MEHQGIPPTALPASFRDGRYRVLELLGAGSQKRVYRAHDDSLDRDVAIAIVESKGLDEAQLARLAREARATGRLGSHHNIATIHDIWYEDGQPYIVTEYMSGGDLSALLEGAEDHCLPWQKAAQIAEKICRALEHAHALAVIHRDIKPANIWFAGDGTPKLGDFGLALVQDLSRLSAEGMIVGTIAYLPPEQAVGRPTEVESDLYSLGAVLYEMTTGRPPFVGENASSVIAQHMNVAPIAPSAFKPEIPRVLDELILQMLAKQPEDRPESAAAVAERLASMRATAAPRDDAEAPGDPLSPGSFVGRREELRQLRSAIDEALSGRTQLRVLVGEAGIGKSRTSEELAAYAKLRGASVFYGRCYEGRGAPAYWPWVQLLRAYAQAREPQELLSQLGSRAAVIAQVAPTALEGLPPLDPPPAVDPDQARFRFFDSVVDVIRRAAIEQPLLLVLEDVQWADEPSLLLLEFLARDLRDARVLIAATCRSTEIDRSDPAAQTLTSLSRESIHDRIVLRGMSEADVGELLVSLGGHHVAEEFIRDIHRQTEGNPFFIEEMLRHLADEGVIQRDAGGWVGGDALGSIGVPEGVRAVIGHRLSRLSQGCREILTIGAVIGRDFSLAAAAEASGRPRAEILEVIQEAASSSVLVKPPGGHLEQFSFSHALIRESLYEELGPLQRAHLHRQVGEGLEKLYGTDVEPHVAELARHFCEAMHDGDPAKAIDYSTRAAERANGLLAYEEAARHYERALQALGLVRPLDDATECQILLALADTIWSMGETNTARETFLRAAAVARRAGDAQLLAGAALGAGGRYPGLQIGILDETLVALLEEALASLEGTDSPPVAEIMARLAEALTFSGAPDRRVRLARAAIEMARRHGDPVELGKVLQHVHMPLWGPDNVEERLAMSSEMLALARQTGATGVALAAGGWQLVHLMETGDIEAVRRELDDYCRVVEELHQPVYQYVAHLRKTMCVLLDGRFDEAAELATQTIPLGQQAQVDTAAQTFGAQTFQIRMAQGSLAELEPGVAALVEQYPAVPGWRIALALLYAETERPSQARKQLDRVASKEFEDLPRDINFNPGLALLSMVVAYLGDASRAGLLYELLLPQAQRCVQVAGTAPLGAAANFLGLLASTLERWEHASAHFEAALATNARIGARPWVAHTGHGYATMLAARGLPGDAAKGLELLDEAQPIALELGMQPLADRIRTLRAGLKTAGGRGGTKS